ncbi:MAG: glycoside hydrolase family 2 protein [Fimbriimonas sp.]
MVQTTFLHANWQFAERSWQTKGAQYGYSRLEWLEAEVPGHVHLDLIRHGVISDPFDRMKELGAQWVDQKAWSYRTTFAWEADDELPTRVLRFEGLDTVCEVLLNGEVIAQHDNMHVALEVDVTTKLKEGENELLINFESPVRTAEDRRDDYFQREGIAADATSFLDRSFVRKMQCMYGWDWGPRLASCGIWRPVCLLEFASRVTDTWVKQHHADGKVTLEIAVETEGEGVPVTTFVDPYGDEVGYVAGNGTIEVADPVLWWPRGEGDQPLYTLVTSLNGDDVVQTIGLRTIKLIQEPDEMGSSFEFEVNGRRIYIRGANWIPDHSFPASITPARYREQILRAADMNMNMLRIWGGGLYEQDAFYDVCDEVGMLVWQDFLFACSLAADTDEYYEAIRVEATANIRRLRNRTSLAIWCGNNENCQLWYDRWGGDKMPGRFYGEVLYFNLLPELVGALDHERPYWPGSAWGGDSPNQGGIGDQHNWDVWHGRGDWRYYSESTARFCSEFGFAASPALSVWDDILAEEDWDPRSPVVRWHDKTLKGTETFIGFVKLHYPDPVTLEDWTYYSQLNQRDALRYGIEFYRRSTFCKGTIIWQLNDCWPTQSWAVLDSSANYKAAAYEMRRIYAANLLSIERDEATVRVYAVNDTQEAIESWVTLRGHDLKTGETLLETEGNYALAAGERKVVLEALVSGLSVPEIILVAEDKRDSTWQLLGEPKDAQFAPAEPIVISTAHEGVLEVQVSSPVVDLMLTWDGSPAVFEDNFLTLPEGGSAIVRISEIPDSVEARSLSGVHKVRLTRSPL